MPTKNLMLFIALSFTFMCGWLYFQHFMGWGGRVPDQAKPPLPPVVKAVPPVPPWPFPGQKEREREAMRGISDRLLLTPNPVANAFGMSLFEIATLDSSWPPVKPEPPKIVEPKIEHYTLGAEGYKLNVELTNRGGGVERVTLNQFLAADQWGRPAPNDKKLDLVPGVGDPSHLLFLYQKPDDNRPVDTLGKRVWELDTHEHNPDADEQKIVFTTKLPEQKLRFTKTFTLKRGEYHVGLAVKIERYEDPGAGAGKVKYQLTGAHGLPIEGEWFTYIYRNALVGWLDNKGGGWRHLDSSTQISHWNGGDLQPRGDKALIYGAIAVQYFASVVAVDNEQESRDFLQAIRPTLEAAAVKGRIKARTQDSFVLATSGASSITFKLADIPGLKEQLRDLTEGQGVAVVWTMRGDDFVATSLRSESETNPLFFDDVTVRLISEPLTLNAGQSVEHKYVLYNGPVKVRQLGQLTGDRAVDPQLVERYEDLLNLNTLTDYQSPGWAGSFSSGIGLTYLVIKFTNLMHWLLHTLHGLVPYYGLNIIMLTVMVRGIMFPISRRQMHNQVTMQEKMAKLNPEVKKLEEKYKGDFNAFNQAKTEVYSRNGINPMSTLGGCLLLFAQMPIFLGLYYALQESIHFRLTPFLWIENLSAPDMMKWWGEQIPMISTPASQGGFLYLGPFFNLLPIVAVLLTLVQQKIMMPKPPPGQKLDEQQEMQQKMMKYMMVVFGFMFYKMAAGLVIYFIASSSWALAERKLFPPPKVTTVGGAAPPPGPSDNGDKGRPKSRGPRSGIGKSKSSRDRKEPENNGTLQKLKSWWEEVLEQAKKK